MMTDFRGKKTLISRLGFIGRSAKNTPPPAGDVQLVGTLNDLDNIPPGSRVIFAGDLVMQGLGEVTVGTEYVLQIPRAASSFTLSRKATTIRVWIHKDALALARERNLKASLAIDGIMRWGLRQRDDTVLVFLSPYQRGTMANIYAFRKGALVEEDERMLPYSSSGQYRHAIESVVSDLHSQHPDYALRAYGAPDDIDGLVVVKDILEKPIYRHILENNAKLSPVEKLALPTLVLGAGALVYMAIVAVDYQRFQGAQQAYDAAIQAAKEFGNAQRGAIALRTLEERRRFLDEANTPDKLVTGLEKILSILATTGATVKEASANDADKDNKIAVINFDVPTAKGMPAIEQASPILRHLSQQLGMSLILREVRDGGEGKVRNMTVDIYSASRVAP